jgi:methylated-DNA-[protein]-cysteine S-methyltransferase
MSTRGVCCLILPCSSKREAEDQFSNSINSIRGVSSGKPTLRDWSYFEQVAEYVNGGRRCFSIPLDLQGFSPFVRRVWKTTQRVPFGQTRSYGWIARQAGKPRAYRAVGNALGKNPVPIVIPCHRIVRSNGSLGGFGAGLPWKKRLLVHEGVML